MIKLTTDDRQNEPINHRLRAGQENSHFRLPMKAVHLLWTHRSSSHVPCPFPSFKRTLLSVKAKVWFKQPSWRKGGLNSFTSFRTSFLWYLLPTSLPSMSSWSPSACRSNPTMQRLCSSNFFLAGKLLCVAYSPGLVLKAMDYNSFLSF